MFTPREQALERGWPGRIEGDRVVQLAAQTLQSFFSGGGQARAHAEYPLARVALRAPVLHPPSVRVFDGDDFAFANPAAIYGPEDEIPSPAAAIGYELRPAAIIGGEGEVGGITLLNVLTAPELGGAKARDFALVLGPIVLTPDEPAPKLAAVDWPRLVGQAARNTRLVPGDVIAADPVESGSADGLVELAVDDIGVLRNRIAR